jgi:hypothetical protein
VSDSTLILSHNDQLFVGWFGTVYHVAAATIIKTQRLGGARPTT